MHVSLLLVCCLSVSFPKVFLGQGVEASATLKALPAADTLGTSDRVDSVPALARGPLEFSKPQAKTDAANVLLGGGIGALVGAFILCPGVSGSGVSCVGWALVGGLVGAGIASVF